MLLKGHLPLKPLAIITDASATAGSFFLAFWVRGLLIKAVPFGAITDIKAYYPLLPAVVFLWIWLLTIFGAYNSPMFVSFRKEMRLILKTAIFGVLMLFAGMFFFRFDVTLMPRSFVFIFFVLNVSALTIEKSCLFCLVVYERKKGRILRSAVVVGDEESARKTFGLLTRHPEYGLKPIGIFADNAERGGINSDTNSDIIGNIHALGDFLHKSHVDEVFVSAERKEIDVKNILSVCEMEGVKTRVVANLLNEVRAGIRAERLGGALSFIISKTPEKEWELFFKRITDMAVSTFFLVVLTPLFLAIAVAIKTTSKGPIFYEWIVMGFNKRQFKSWKFRTMVTDADKLKEKLMDKNEMTGPVFKIKNDPRITPVGRLLRRFSLDELPQILSVFKGDMSLVGPRPPLVSEAKRFERWHGRKLRIKPGLTCLWQVNGRNDIKDFDEWVRLDLDYIENWSLWLDFKILVKTVPAVIRGSGR